VRVLAGLAVIVLLTACGGGGNHPSPSRAAVKAYLTHVNDIEFRMQLPLSQVASATAAFGHARYSSELTASLAAAQNTLLDLYAQLVLIKPPPQARKLHSMLLTLVQRQASLADQLRGLTIFNPAFASILRPLVTANVKTAKALRATKKPAVVAAAIHSYRLTIHRIIPRVRKLQPPKVERPLYTAQLTRLAALDEQLAQLEQAVGAHDLTALAQAEHAVSVASVSSDTRANQLAQRAAVLAFNARVASVKALSRQVQLERDRLQVSLP